MARMKSTGRTELITAIASRSWTASQLSQMFHKSIDELKLFVEANREAIEDVRQVYEDLEDMTDTEIDDLWISKKGERLKRLQLVAEALYVGAISTYDTTILREFRSYLVVAANELGQLMHRGSGSGDDTTVNYTINGVDLEDLK